MQNKRNEKLFFHLNHHQRETFTSYIEKSYHHHHQRLIYSPWNVRHLKRDFRWSTLCNITFSSSPSNVQSTDNRACCRWHKLHATNVHIFISNLLLTTKYIGIKINHTFLSILFQPEWDKRGSQTVYKEINLTNMLTSSFFMNLCPPSNDSLESCLLIYCYLL